MQLYGVSQAIQDRQQASHREPSETTSQELRYLRLCHPDRLRSFGLGPSFLVDKMIDLKRDLGLKDALFWMG